MPVTTIGVMETLVRQSGAQFAFRMWLMSAFAGIALLLAALGVYAVMAYAVQPPDEGNRDQDRGRCRPQAVTWMIVTTQLGYSLAGISAGVVCAVWLTRLLDSLLFGVAPGDPTVFASAVTVLATVGGRVGVDPCQTRSPNRSAGCAARILTSE